MALYRKKGIRSDIDEKKIKLIGDIDALVSEQCGPEATGGEPFSRVCQQLLLMDHKALRSMLLYVASMTEKDPELKMLYLKNKAFSLCPKTNDEVMKILLKSRLESGDLSPEKTRILNQVKQLFTAPSNEQSRLQSVQESLSIESGPTAPSTRRSSREDSHSGRTR